MEINFRHEINGQKVITAVAQDADTNQILMLANMNKEALQKTIETGKAHYWSTSRNKIWLKGESSGHFQEVEEILVDCDMDAIVFYVIGFSKVNIPHFQVQGISVSKHHQVNVKLRVCPEVFEIEIIIIQELGNLFSIPLAHHYLQFF